MCNGYGVLPYGPYGEEPECRYCHGSGEVPCEPPDEEEDLRAARVDKLHRQLHERYG